MNVCVPHAPKGALISRRVPAQAASSQPGQVGFDRSFVNEHKPVRMCTHRRDAVLEPVVPQMLYASAQPLGRDQ